MNEDPEKLSDAYHKAVGADRQYTIALVLTEMELGIVLSGWALFTVGFVLTAFPIAFIPSILTGSMVAVGFLLMLIVVLVGMQNGKRTAEELS